MQNNKKSSLASKYLFIVIFLVTIFFAGKDLYLGTTSSICYGATCLGNVAYLLLLLYTGFLGIFLNTSYGNKFIVKFAIPFCIISILVYVGIFLYGTSYFLSNF
jgi:hypothetical protein